MRALGFIVLGVSVLVLLLLAGGRMLEILQVDGCVDKGGSYNYVTKGCDFGVAHPPSAYLKRHPEVAWASTAALVGFLWSLYQVRRSPAAKAK